MITSVFRIYYCKDSEKKAKTNLCHRKITLLLFEIPEKRHLMKEVAWNTLKLEAW